MPLKRTYESHRQGGKEPSLYPFCPAVIEAVSLLVFALPFIHRPCDKSRRTAVFSVCAASGLNPRLVQKIRRGFTHCAWPAFQRHNHACAMLRQPICWPVAAICAPFSENFWVMPALSTTQNYTQVDTRQSAVCLHQSASAHDCGRMRELCRWLRWILEQVRETTAGFGSINSATRRHHSELVPEESIATCQKATAFRIGRCGA